MAEIMEGLLAGIQQSDLATGLRRSFILYPLVSALHVAATGGLLTAVGVLHARQFGFFDALEPVLLEKRFTALAVGLFTLALISGALLFSVNASDYVQNAAFRFKAFLILLAGINLFAYRLAARHAVASGVNGPTRLFAITSACLWIAVLMCGRFVAFV